MKAMIYHKERISSLVIWLPNSKQKQPNMKLTVSPLMFLCFLLLIDTCVAKQYSWMLPGHQSIDNGDNSQLDSKTLYDNLKLDPAVVGEKNLESIEKRLSSKIDTVLRLVEKGFYKIYQKMNDFDEKINRLNQTKLSDSHVLKEDITQIKNKIDSESERMTKLQNIMIANYEISKNLKNQLPRVSLTPVKDLDNSIDISEEKSIDINSGFKDSDCPIINIPERVANRSIALYSDIVNKKLTEEFSAIDFRINGTINQIMRQINESDLILKIAERQHTFMEEVETKVRHVYNVAVMNKDSIDKLFDLVNKFPDKVNVFLKSSLNKHFKNVAQQPRTIEKAFDHQQKFKDDFIIPTETLSSEHLSPFYRPTFQANENCKPINRPQVHSCAEIYKQTSGTCDGVYVIEAYVIETLYCSDMNPLQGFTGGWIVILRRGRSNTKCPANKKYCDTSFNEKLIEYFNGFGDMHHGEFFLGLELISKLVNKKRYMLQIDLEAENGDWASFRYQNFRLEKSWSKQIRFLFDEIEILSQKESNIPENDYKKLAESLLRLNGSFLISNDVEDSFPYQRSLRTQFRDNLNLDPLRECAKKFQSPWWMPVNTSHALQQDGELDCDKLVDVNLFAPLPGIHREHVYWNNWASLSGEDRKIKNIIMKIRPMED